jgi:anti-anti-sigma regulatory factor
MLEVRRDGAQLEIRGELDAEGGRRLLEAIVGADGDVRVDGSGLEHIDGAGLTALAVARCRFRAEGRVFEVTTLATDAASGLRAARVLPRLFAAPTPAVAERAITTTTATTTPTVNAPAATASVATRPALRGRHRFRHRNTRKE